MPLPDDVLDVARRVLTIEAAAIAAMATRLDPMLADYWTRGR